MPVFFFLNVSYTYYCSGKTPGSLRYGPGFSPSSFSPSCPVVVHVVGGVTYEEIKAVADLNSELGANITIGSSDTVWRSQDFMDHVRNYNLKEISL